MRMKRGYCKEERKAKDQEKVLKLSEMVNLTCLARVSKDLKWFAGLLNHRQEKTGSPSGFATGPFSDSLAVPFSTSPNQPARKGDVRDNGHVLWAKWG